MNSQLPLWITIVLLLLAFPANAQSTQACDSSSGVCVAFSIPVTSQTTSPAVILTTVQAPGGVGWVSFGFGQEMAGSLMFVLWADGSNLVVSPRYSTGHSEPSVYSGPTVKVLSSTITSSQFTAQLQLSNSTTWVNSGSLDIGSSDASVIWAYGSSAPSNPSNPNSDFQEHDGKGTFSINMVSAQVVQQGPSPTSPAATGVPTGNDTTTNGTTTESTPTGSFPAAPVITGVSHAGTVIGLSYRDKVIIAHGTIMGICFAILFPLGSIIIRFLSSCLPVPLKLHYGTQIFSLLLVIIATGLGINASTGMQFISFHQVFGIIILLLIFVQGGFGYYHHHRFVKDRPSSRRWFTHTHLWLGRFIILSGLLNCGCGLLLVFIDWKYVILWWIICGLFAIAYAIASVMTLRYRAKKVGERFGSATGNVFNPERYKRAEAYEMDTSNRSITGMI